jgi:hypothetical protein
MRFILIIALLLLESFSFASTYDKEIVLLEQNRNDKVSEVFKQMMAAYQEEDINGFFSYVSEDRFIQDYMTFHEAMREDFRTYDTLSFESWVNKITEDGIKRFLYVRWEKRFISTQTDEEITLRGYTRFLFDEINGEYKLIEVAGNHLWGSSLPEWKNEVQAISGQEIETSPSSGGSSGTVDLIVENIACPMYGGAMPISFTLKNNGSAAVSSVPYSFFASGMPSNITSGSYSGSIASGGSVVVNSIGDCYPGSSITVTVDPDNLIVETVENNNKLTQSF